MGNGVNAENAVRAEPAEEHRLTLVEVIDELVAEGLVAAEQREQFKQERR